MRDIVQPVKRFSYAMACSKCGAMWTAEASDLAVGGFKVSGNFFDGSAVCKDRFFVWCPFKCDLFFVPDEVIPPLLQRVIRKRCLKNEQ